MKKNKRILEIADELDGMAEKHHDASLKEVAALLRKSVPSAEKTNEQSSEGDEEDGGIEVPKKPPPPQP